MQSNFKFHDPGVPCPATRARWRRPPATARYLFIVTKQASDRPTSRWRASRPPAGRDPWTGPSSGVVELPLRLYWSDRHNRFDLADHAERRLLYQIVLSEGSADDVGQFLHLPTMLNIWDQLWLSAAVHDAWDRWVAIQRHVAV